MSVSTSCQLLDALLGLRAATHHFERTASSRCRRSAPISREMRATMGAARCRCRRPSRR